MLGALAFVLAVTASGAEVTPSESAMQVRWTAIVRHLPPKPATCFDFARWLCAAEATVAYGHGVPPNTIGCLSLHDGSRILDEYRANRKRCAGAFLTAVKKTREYEVSMRSLAESEGRQLPKPDLSHGAIVRSMSFMAVLSAVFRDALR